MLNTGNCLSMDRETTFIRTVVVRLRSEDAISFTFNVAAFTINDFEVNWGSNGDLSPGTIVRISNSGRKIYVVADDTLSNLEHETIHERQ